MRDQRQRCVRKLAPGLESPDRGPGQTGTCAPGVFLSLALIASYQLILAPLFVGGGCRHWPTCSRYAEEAIRTHGFRRGWALALRRLGRCRPGGTFGYDPVPRPSTSSDSASGSLRNGMLK